MPTTIYDFDARLKTTMKSLLYDVTFNFAIDMEKAYFGNAWESILLKIRIGNKVAD